MTQSRSGTYSRKQPAKQGNPLGCLVSILTLLVILALIIGAGFVFIARPYAQAQLDQAMTQAVNQIPDTAALLPPGPISVTNNFLTNIIAVNLAPSDPIKNPKVTITPQGIQIAIDILGQPCTMQGLPQLANGELSATHVQVGGLLGLFISPDEATTMLNRHLSAAQAKLRHPIQNLQLQDSTMTITLGAPSLV